MAQRDEMRAADTDREKVAERLRSALNEGRLDLHEYDDRLQRAYAAKTYGDLDVLLADLPGTVPAERAAVIPVGEAAVWTPGVGGRYPDATRRWLIDVWDEYAAAVTICTAVWAAICLASWEVTYFWPGWVAGPWGAVLLVTTLRGLLTGEPQRWAAKRAHKQRAAAEKRARQRADRDLPEGSGG